MKIEIEGGSLFWIAWACPYVVDAFHEEFGSFFSQFEWTHPCEAGCALMFMMFVVIVLHREPFCTVLRGNAVENVRV